MRRYLKGESSIKLENEDSENGMIQSMSKVGKCIDNGPMEGLLGVLKFEIFHGIHFENEQALINKIEECI